MRIYLYIYKKQLIIRRRIENSKESGGPWHSGPDQMHQRGMQSLLAAGLKHANMQVNQKPCASVHALITCCSS
jgi:hypothetical protein